MENKFIVLEGIDGCGKSTQAEALADIMTRSRGHSVVVTHGLTGPVGSAVREVLRGGDVRSMASEVAILMAAGLEATWNDVIEPALLDGSWVICDRWLLSTYAYQYGAGMAPIEIFGRVVGMVGRHDPLPVNVILHVPVEVALSRAGRDDGMEQGDIDFYYRAEAWYRSASAQERFPRLGPVVDINANADEAPEVVTQRILHRLITAE